MLKNPFVELSKEDMARLDEEIKIRKARQNLLDYELYVNPGYKSTKFHKFLCDTVQNFLEEETGHAIDVLLVSVPPQFGKQESLNQDILTTKGWKKFGDLKVGDKVYGPNGKAIKVTNIIPQPEPCTLAVTTTDGSVIKVHPNHEWVVYDRNKHKYTTVETKYMLEQGLNCGNSTYGRGHRYRFNLPHIEPLDNEHKNLPLDPYTLGVWLGDGVTTSPTVCAHPKDIIVLNSLPYKHSSEWVHKTTKVIYRYYPEINKIKKYGLCTKESKQSKRIPEDYLTASLEQRLSLLAGLLDTDGTLDKKHNRYTFTTSDIGLKDTFKELIATFGWRCSEFEQKPFTSTSGIVGKKCYWQLCFNPTLYIPCKIERKQLTTFSKQRRISIAKIEPIDPEPGQCISVEGGVYLTGKTLKPTHNSTTITETVPAWMLGRHPDRKWIIASYNSDFATTFGRKNKQKCEEFNPKIFPGFKLADNPCNNIEFETTKKGGVYSAGLLAGITGHSAYYVIIDDPIKTMEEALSATTKEKLWNEYLASVRSRMAAGGKIIVIQTRWAEDDLYGRILENEDHVTRINIQCECTDPKTDPLKRKKGEGLCEEIGKGTKWLHDFKKIYKSDKGSRAWEALYQGNPMSIEDEIIKQSWWKYYDDEDLPDLPYKILSVDAAFKGDDKNDFIAITKWGKRDNKYYLLKVINEHMDFVTTVNKIRELREEDPEIMFVLVEDKANGSAIINVLSNEMDGVIPINPLGGKIARLNAVASAVERGDVYLNRREYWNEEIRKQCAYGPQWKHDDIADSISQALNRMIFVDADVVAPKHVKYTEWKDFQFEDFENADDELKEELLKLWGQPIQWLDDFL